MPHQHVKIENTHIEFSIAGPQPCTAPTLIFLHEGLGCLDLWKDFPERLRKATGLGCFVYSRAGYGRSDPARLPLRPSYLHEQAAVLEQLLARFEIQQPILVGHSDGATIALIYAGSLMHPAPLKVIVEAPHVFVEAAALTGIHAIEDRFKQSRLRAALRQFHGDKSDDTFRAWSGAWQSPEFRDWNIKALLPAITSPVLIVQGTEDEYATLAQVDAIAESVSGPVETAILEGCRHIPHQQRAHDTLRIMKKFIVTSPSALALALAAGGPVVPR